MNAGTSIQRRASLLTVFLVVLIDMLGFGVVFPLLPICARDFGAGENGFIIGLLAASFSAMQCIFSPIWGRLSDRIGRRPVLVAGLTGSALCYGLLGRAIEIQSLNWLFVARVGAGIFGATITTAQAYVADTTPPHMRARGMTLISVAFGLGFTLGPILGGLLMLVNTDRIVAAAGYAAAAFSACAALLAHLFLVESRGNEPAPPGKRLLHKEPIRKVALQPAVLPLLFGLFLSVSAFSVFEATLPLLLTKSFGPKGPFCFEASAVLFAFSYLGATIALMQGLIVRPLLALVSEAVLAAAGAIAQILGFAAMTITVQTGSLVGLLTASTLLVAGLALLMPSLNSLISRRTDRSNQGCILGISQSAGAVARVVGPLLGVPLLYRPFILPLALPYLVGSCLTAGALVTIEAAHRIQKADACGALSNCKSG